MTKSFMQTVRFFKMQALGNDFVIIDTVYQNFVVNNALINRMSDRHKGIGFDQLLLLSKSVDPKVDRLYRIFNADGQEVTQCGNGARSVALYLSLESQSNTADFLLKTQTGNSIRCQYRTPESISVFIEPPQYKHTSLPEGLEGVLLVYLGNPHAVVFCEDLYCAKKEQHAVFLQKDARFPEGINVSLVKKLAPGHIAMRIFERGVGETQACGSAACAAAVISGQQLGFPVLSRVDQPGGVLFVRYERHSEIELIGPASFVFNGEYHFSVLVDNSLS